MTDAEYTAPRITVEDIGNNIAAEIYANGLQLLGEHDEVPDEVTKALSLLTICVVMTKNGFTVVGKSAPVSAENFRAEVGERVAREDAVEQLWPLMGYALKDKLAKEAA